MYNIDEIKQYLRVTEESEDNLIIDMLKCAIIYAEKSVGFEINEEHKDLKIAIFMHIASLYDNRGEIDACPEASLQIYNTYRKIQI